MTTLLEEMTQIIAKSQASDRLAETVAELLIFKFGEEACRQQLDWFPRRCEPLQQKGLSLHNPAGLFIKSIVEKWAAPLPPEEPQHEKD